MPKVCIYLVTDERANADNDEEHDDWEEVTQSAHVGNSVSRAVVMTCNDAAAP